MLRRGPRWQSTRASPKRRRASARAAGPSTGRANDHVAVGLRALATSLDPVELLEAHMHGLPLDGRHRLELDCRMGRDCLLGATHRQRLESCAAPFPVPGRIDDDILAVVRARAPDDRIREVLDRVDRLTVLADQEPEIRAGARRRDRFVVLEDVDPATDADPGGDAFEQLAHVCRELAVAVGGALCRVRVDLRDDSRRRIADAQEPSLALRDDLELDGALVEPRMELLELAQRGPLGLADGLAGRLDLAQVLRHRLAFPFFRFTRRGAAGGADALSSAGSAVPSRLCVSDFGGVRDDRFGGGFAFGIICRVTRPWPTVQRFVVTQ